MVIMNSHQRHIEQLSAEQHIRELLNDVYDPEVPVLSVIDLGIIRDINLHDDDIEIVITPTYSGCPAMDVISMSIKMELLSHGYKNIKIKSVLSPAWTTDWMSDEGKQKLKEFGIAPPNPKQQVCRDELFAADEGVQCPLCNSWHTHRISEFGSTACKALFVCDECKEPFDYFKCH
jgi:ring-1,2-phenylacetyl-CoA epoxidase subunit PaaD